MLFFGDAKGKERSAFQRGDGFALQGVVGAHQDGEEAEERHLEAVPVGGTEVGEELQETRVAKQIELAAGRGEGFGG